MNILIVCHSYPPGQSPRAYRWSSIAEFWSGLGHNVSVVTSYDPSSSFEVLNGVFVYRLKSSVMETLRHYFKKKKNNLSKNSDEQPSVVKNKSLIKKIHDLTWKKIYWPDSSCLTYFPMVTLAKKIYLKNKYDVLITVSHPFCGHLVGKKIKKIFPDLPWIVDIGDPFFFLDVTPVNNLFLYSKLNFIQEKTICKESDFISVTTPETLNLYKKKFPESKNKIFHIPPLVNIKHKANRLFIDDMFDKNKINISFLGVLYKNLREPGGVLKLVQDAAKSDQRILTKLKLHFWGNISQCYDIFEKYPDVANLIEFHGMVSKEDSWQVMRQSDILLNIGNKTSYQLPSKVVEYATTGKPIINISTIEGDSSKNYLTDHPCVFFYTENSVVNINTFIDFVFASKDIKIDCKYVDQVTNNHSVENIALSYMKLIEQIACRNK